MEVDWDSGDVKVFFLKIIYVGVCWMFIIVLGLEVDLYYVSYIYLDMGCYGKDCMYLIC